MRVFVILLAVLFTSLALPMAGGSDAWAQVRVPDRQVPPSVLNEVRVLESRFNAVLASDCDPSRCYAKGCIYVDHAVADRPRTSSLPGLGQDGAPRTVDAQEYLTQAQCAFATERGVSARDAESLAARLQDKLSTGWTVVSVVQQQLKPIPAYLREPPAEPEPEDTDVDEDTDAAQPEVDTAPPPLTPEIALREAWSTLLPHTAWMIALLLLTLAVTAVIWAWRRVGRDSLEDRLLLAELGRGEGGAPAVAAEVEDDAPSEGVYIQEQHAAWQARLSPDDGDPPDRELQTLIAELLRSGEHALLAKAVLTFPETLPAAFPSGAAGGELAAAKLAFADYLKDVDPDSLPDDATFFRTLGRRALAAAVASQADARTVRALHEDFGTTGVATLLGSLPARPAALLFALAPLSQRDELVRLLEPTQLAAMADMLLRSNRMSPTEDAYLVDVLDAARAEQPVPPASRLGDVSDRGEAFDASGPLSALLESMHPDRRTALFNAALDRTHGTLPDWTRGLLVSDMLLALSDESRADLILELPLEPVAAWMSMLDPEVAARLLDGLPSALRSSIAASSVFGSRAQQTALAEQGRAALARAFQAQLSRSGLTFSQVLRAGGGRSA